MTLILIHSYKFFLDLLNSINNNHSDFSKKINKELKNNNNDINPFLANKNSNTELQSVINRCPNCPNKSNFNIIVKEMNFEIRKNLNLVSKLSIIETNNE